jgi:hypothetical protein
VPGARQATNVMFGYLEGVERKDAESYARAFGRRCLKSSESCWYAVEPLWSGYLYEIHEGGPGYSFLPALAKEIDANPGGVALVPSGRRVFELTVRNGRPVGALLSETRSREVQSRMAVVQPADRVGDRPFGLIVPAWAPQGHVRFHAILTSRRMKRLSPAIPLRLAAAAVGFLAGTALLLGGGVTYYWSPLTGRRTGFPPRAISTSTACPTASGTPCCPPSPPAATPPSWSSRTANGPLRPTPLPKQNADPSNNQ